MNEPSITDGGARSFSPRIDPERPTLRDQFAMAALTGPIAAWPHALIGKWAADMNLKPGEYLARSAYDMADAMLTERSRKP